MHPLVQLLESVGLDVLLDVPRELLLVLGVVLLLEVLHELPHVSPEDALAMLVGVVLLRVAIVPRESLLGVRDVESAVGGPLEGAEDAATGGGGLASHVEEGAEGPLVLVDLIDVVGRLPDDGRHDVAVDLVVALVDVVEADLLEEAAGAQQSGAVGGGVVLEADLEAVPRELVRARGAQDAIAVDEAVHDLAYDLLVREAHDQAVLGTLVLVLGLAAQALALAVVGLALATTSVLDLEALVVRLGLLDLDERLRVCVCVCVGGGGGMRRIIV